MSAPRKRLISAKTGERLLAIAGWTVVWLVVAFIILPAVVVGISAFNDRAILSFPPQAWSTRWFARAFFYRDFSEGFRNGLIITAFASSIALVVCCSSTCRSSSCSATSAPATACATSRPRAG